MAKTKVRRHLRRTRKGRVPVRKHMRKIKRKSRKKPQSPSSLLKTWKHKDAARRAMHMMEVFGPPSYYGNGVMGWKNVPRPYTEMEVRDESIHHSFPVPHRDYLYSTMKINVPANLMDDLGNVTGSIIIDPLKGTVTARCAHLVKNAVTLGFVQDVVNGKVKGNLKEEYGRRIINNETPLWFVDYLDDV